MAVQLIVEANLDKIQADALADICASFLIALGLEPNGIGVLYSLDPDAKDIEIMNAINQEDSDGG